MRIVISIRGRPSSSREITHSAYGLCVFLIYRGRTPIRKIFLQYPPHRFSLYFLGIYNYGYIF